MTNLTNLTNGMANGKRVINPQASIIPAGLPVSAQEALARLPIQALHCPRCNQGFYGVLSRAWGRDACPRCD